MSDEAIEASGLRVKAMLETLGSGYTQYTADKIAETAIGPLQARIERLEAALRPFAEGSIDVSGAAVIVGHRECAAALTEARAALKDDPA